MPGFASPSLSVPADGDAFQVVALNELFEGLTGGVHIGFVHDASLSDLMLHSLPHTPPRGRTVLFFLLAFFYYYAPGLQS